MVLVTIVAAAVGMGMRKVRTQQASSGTVTGDVTKNRSMTVNTTTTEGGFYSRGFDSNLCTAPGEPSLVPQKSVFSFTEIDQKLFKATHTTVVSAMYIDLGPLPDLWY